MANSLCDWANYHCSKWPNIGEIFFSSGHTDPPSKKSFTTLTTFVRKSFVFISAKKVLNSFQTLTSSPAAAATANDDDDDEVDEDVAFQSFPIKKDHSDPSSLSLSLSLSFAAKSFYDFELTLGKCEQSFFDDHD